MYTIVKRFFDLSSSILLLVLFFPFIFLIGIFIFAQTKRSPFFIQKRPGKNEELFSLIKFKTMTDAKDENGLLMDDQFRLTNLGKILRKLSLDELPQLLNVLKGDMSLVGPRPLLVRYLERYSDYQRQRHDVRPGITGWAQVNGRNAISWEEKFDLDVWYTKNFSFLVDIKIICLTIVKVIMRSGISSKTSATMEEFYGSNSK